MTIIYFHSSVLFLPFLTVPAYGPVAVLSWRLIDFPCFRDDHGIGTASLCDWFQFLDWWRRNPDNISTIDFYIQQSVFDHRCVSTWTTTSKCVSWDYRARSSAVSPRQLSPCWRGLHRITDMAIQHVCYSVTIEVIITESVEVVWKPLTVVHLGQEWYITGKLYYDPLMHSLPF